MSIYAGPSKTSMGITEFHGGLLGLASEERGK
jgi:hypothetical protein